jgi:hypothetical protein
MHKKVSRIKSSDFRNDFLLSGINALHPIESIQNNFSKSQKT